MSGLPATWWQDLAPISLAESETGADGLTRSWVMLMPERTYATSRYGKLNFSEPELRQYKASFDAKARGIEIALDADHQAPNQNKTQAYGWLERVELGGDIGRKPGLWGLVRWTPLGLSDVKNQIYRYISAEIQPGKWKNEVTNQTHSHVLFGATLTNRPVLKDIEPVTLADVSTAAWGTVEKTKLPNACFLDPKNRRLPVYEGAGPVVNGKYSKRGKLNINGVKAALAAIHGARSGTAMTGLPSGLAGKLQGWLDDYAASDGGSDGGDTKAAEVGRVGVMSTAGTADDQEFEDDEEESGDELLADDPDQDGDDDSADSGDDFDIASDTHGAMDTSGHTHGQYGKHSHSDDGDHSDAPMKGGKGSKQMSEGRVTLAEHLKLVEEVKQLRRANYEKDVSTVLGGWEAGKQQFSESKGKRPNGEAAKGIATTKPVRVVLSRPAMQQAKKVMLAEWFADLEEEQRAEIGRAIELAATGAVDLSVRGGANDTERVKTTKLSVVQPSGDEKSRTLSEVAAELAEAAGDDFEDLREVQQQRSPEGNEARLKVEKYYRLAKRQVERGA